MGYVETLIRDAPCEIEVLRDVSGLGREGSFSQCRLANSHWL